MTTIQRHISLNMKMSLCKLPVILVRVHRNLNFLDRFWEKIQIPKFHQNPSSGSRVVPSGRVDGRKEGQTRQS